METATLSTYELKRGSDYFEILAFFDKDDQPIDLTTYTAIKQTIRDGITRTARELHTISLGSGITITGEDNNILEFHIPSSTTDGWYGGKYFRDILFEINGKKFHYAEGMIVITENVTTV